MKELFKILGISLLSFCMVNCMNRLEEGEVYEKEFKPSYSRTMLMPLCISNGKTINTVMMPYVVSYPDRWLVKIKKYNGEKWLYSEYYTSKEVYQSLNIGDEFKYISGRDLLEEPYSREKQEKKQLE